MSWHPFSQIYPNDSYCGINSRVIILETNIVVRLIDKKLPIEGYVRCRFEQKYLKNSSLMN